MHRVVPVLIYFIYFSVCILTEDLCEHMRISQNGKWLHLRDDLGDNGELELEL